MRTEHQGTHGTSGRKEERYTRAPGKTSEQLVRPQSGDVIYGPDLIKTWVCCSSELGFENGCWFQRIKGLSVNYITSLR